eukprot:8781857-Pyramimonas_sp.AAC.1
MHGGVARCANLDGDALAHSDVYRHLPPTIVRKSTVAVAHKQYSPTTHSCQRARANQIEPSITTNKMHWVD